MQRLVALRSLRQPGTEASGEVGARCISSTFDALCASARGRTTLAREVTPVGRRARRELDLGMWFHAQHAADKSAHASFCSAAV